MRSIVLRVLAHVATASVCAGGIAAGTMVSGCEKCVDTVDRSEVVIPPPSCNGTVRTNSRDCADGSPPQTWSLPDGGTTDFYAARASWKALSCADACRASNVAPALTECAFEARDAGTLLACYQPGESCYVPVPGKGRRPTRFVPGARETDDVLSYAIAMGELEHASVTAFRRLRRDLVRVRAPRRFLRAASRASDEERRHTRAAFALARRYGGTPLGADVPKVNELDLRALALENVVEGCVHELFGAAMASWACLRAQDRGVRAMMKRVAEEEEGHAELAFRLHHWFGPRLSRADREAVNVAAAAAITSLYEQATPPRLVALGMIPPRDARNAIVDALLDAPWRPFAARVRATERPSARAAA